MSRRRQNSGNPSQSRSASIQGMRRRDERSASPLRRNSHTPSTGSRPDSPSRSSSRTHLPSQGSANTLSRDSPHRTQPDIDGEDDSDEQEEQEDQADNLGSPTGRDDYALHKGRIIGRYRCMWSKLAPILEAGLSRAPDEDPDKFPRRQRHNYRIYLDVVSLAPLLPDHARSSEQLGFKNITQKLELGRNKARSTDIDGYKKNIGLWRKFSPPFNCTIRHEVGFHNDSTGKLLCPAGLDWSDSSVRAGLVNGTTKIAAIDYPKFLWEHDEMDGDDPFQGFMRGDMLVKGFKHIYICPSSAIDGKDSRRSTRTGNAGIHGIRTTSIYAIAYVATLIRFVLSDHVNFSAGGVPGQWPYRDFYKALLKTMTKDMDKEDLEDLLDWWDEQIFYDVVDSDPEEPETHPETSVAGLMQAKAAARRARVGAT